MGFNCGIVGLPNVGKSTLFNALTETAAAEAANYPFCTIEPNTGRVAVPDPRLDALAALAKSQNIIPTQLEFVDIAGLVRGASKGEGLGNQFLGNIREVDAIAHVLRCFDDSDITHVDGDIDRHLGQDYWRIRIGIGRPDNPAMDVKSWVLADFTKTETSGWVADLLRAISDEAPRLTTYDDGGFMSRVAFLAPPPKPPQNETQ